MHGASGGAAESIIVGAIELSLILKEGESALPLLDCARTHVDALLGMKGR